MQPTRTAWRTECHSELQDVRTPCKKRTGGQFVPFCDKRMTGAWAWAAGDTIIVLVKLVPLAKDRIPVQLRLSLREDVRIVTSGGPRTFTRHVSSVAIPVTFTSPTLAADSTSDERPGADQAGPTEYVACGYHSV